MLTEHHCHILPGMDDGAESAETALRMIGMMRAQGVEQIIATPHFYAHLEPGGVRDFLAKRQRACAQIVQADPAAGGILLGAEVAVEHGISVLPDIAALRLADTDYILMELPYTGFQHWYLEEITNLAYEYRLTPVIAHIHRCLAYYSRAEIAEVLRMEAVFQINNEAFGNLRERRFVKSLIREGYPYLFGSDAHNISDRRPNWDLLRRKAGSTIIANAESVL